MSAVDERRRWLRRRRRPPPRRWWGIADCSWQGARPAHNLRNRLRPSLAHAHAASMCVHGGGERPGAPKGSACVRIVVHHRRHRRRTHPTPPHHRLREPRGQLRRRRSRGPAVNSPIASIRFAVW
ncbi:unnamed protein product [Macrosiphum euphorbiae]|uniref:Uncharacterized protein n=1 Tax=Macrosiphum euphorbiae TaxID=13131 RepID=A0AAV0WW35_9HEMI|nr:unnamed protein product [Macrosiphum euphorbiae]